MKCVMGREDHMYTMIKMITSKENDTTGFLMVDLLVIAT